MEDGYAICFNKWALDKRIKNELGLLIIISSLSAEKGYCYASNNYIASQYRETEQSVSNKLKKLERLNYITIEYEKRGCEVVNRKIRLKNYYIDDITNVIPTIEQIFKENNTSINNTSINKYIYSRVIDYLNEKLGTSYKSTTRSTQEHINARLKEGFTEEDFIKVIDKKTKEWKNTKFEKFLRPDTLFSTKFESYLNQKVKENWWDE